MICLPHAKNLVKYFQALIGFYVQKYPKNTTSKNGIIRPLSLLLSELWPIYWFQDFITKILGCEFFEVLFMQNFGGGTGIC